MKIYFLIPVHERHEYLRQIVRQLKSLEEDQNPPGPEWLNVEIILFGDRVTQPVFDICHSLHWENQAIFTCLSAPAICTHEGGEIWGKARNEHLRFAVEHLGAPSWVSIWDDDMFLFDVDEFRNHLLSPPAIIEGPKRYLWSPTHENRRIGVEAAREANRHDPDWRWHASPVAFPYRAGDQFHEDLMTQVTEKVRLDPTLHTKRLTKHVIDVGFMLSEHRASVVKRYKLSGRVDEYVRSILAKPDLEELPPDVQSSVQRLLAWPDDAKTHSGSKP